MANANDLSRLAEEVKIAHEERVKCISDIKQETAGLLSGFDKERKEMADNLRAELATFKSELESAESERKTSDQAEITERGVYIENLLADFDKAHKEMTDDLRAELARVKPDLESAESERKKSDQAEITERGVYMENLLADFDKAHKEMTDDLRAELATFKSELDSAESERKTSDQAEVMERKEAVRNMLDEFGKEQEETAAAWQKLLAAMQSARGRVTITGPASVEAAVEVKSVEEVIEEPEEEAVEEAEEETIEDREELKEGIIEILEDNSEGQKMTQIAEALGIENWRSLIPVMRELLDAGEIRKENSTYYVA